MAPDDIWAVGSNSVDVLQVNLIKHWDGQHWTNVDAPNVSPDGNGLQAVSATSMDDVWAVGYGNGTSILHWNGSVWSLAPIDSIFPVGNLTGVVGVAAGSAWAVGPGTIILHWDGFAWKVVPSPSPGHENYLSGIVSVGPNEAWAVGWVDGDEGYEALAEHLACPGMLGTRTVTR